MNLGKLLAAGKSIMGGRWDINYRVNKHVYLPKFSPAKNPSKLSTGAEPAVAGTDAAAVPVAKRKMALAAAKTQKIATPPEVPSRPASWVGKLNPASLWRAPVPDQPPMQTELSLDGVKVIHNDLSDADVEVVPVKSRTVPEASPPVLPPAKKSWELLGERLFRMEEVA